MKTVKLLSGLGIKVVIKLSLVLLLAVLFTLGPLARARADDESEKARAIVAVQVALLDLQKTSSDHEKRIQALELAAKTSAKSGCVCGDKCDCPPGQCPSCPTKAVSAVSADLADDPEEFVTVRVCTANGCQLVKVPKSSGYQLPAYQVAGDYYESARSCATCGSVNARRHPIRKLLGRLLGR